MLGYVTPAQTANPSVGNWVAWTQLEEPGLPLAKLGLKTCQQVWEAEFSLSPSSLTWLMDCRPVLSTLLFVPGGDFFREHRKVISPCTVGSC